MASAAWMTASPSSPDESSTSSVSSDQVSSSSSPPSPKPRGQTCRCRMLTAAAAGVVGGLTLLVLLAGTALALSLALSRREAADMSSSSESVDVTRSVPSPNGLNVVLFYADDWSWKTLGRVNGVVETPHLDELAKRGVSFDRNCVTTSICWQSRATLYTGLYASVHRHYSVADDSMYGATVRWDQTLYPQLYRAGYQVGFFGKYHAPMPAEHLAYTFDQFRDYWGKHWLERDGRLRHVTDLNKEDALAFLRDVRRTSASTSATSARFALTVSFFATHAEDNQPFPNQYMPTNASAARYGANLTIPLPRTATQEAWERMPWFFTEANEGRRRWRERFDGADRYQESMKRLYRMATEVDDAVGAVVDELQSMGVLNETMIVFTSDNGNFHGEHGLADKWYAHEESIRVPLIIVDPRMPGHLRGTSNDEFTLSIDLAPTLLSAADVPAPSHMQGRDVADLYLLNASSSSAPWREDFFYEFVQPDFDMSYIPSAFALVGREHKYFHWPQSGYEQLFRVSEDPYEENDLFNATDPAVLEAIKARYSHLKDLSQRGAPV